jgi:16S rRNA (adenine1518-N6/adenine1519-N6)-dimethyltransferase
VPRPLLTPTDVRRLLATHGLAPHKSRGQNFVVDPNTVRKVVREAGVTEGELVCEIGPGLGSLTLALREAGTRVVAVEIDAGMVRALREAVGDDPGVKVVHADALEVPFDELLGGEEGVLVSNLPYATATPLLMHTLATGAFSRMLLMVQREAGQRWVARVGDPLYGAVSLKVQAQAEAHIVGTVARGAFYPVPNVDSVTVALRPRPWTLPVPRERLFALIDSGFAQRRKRLRNAIAADGYDPTAIEDALERAGLHRAARAEELDLGQWAAFAQALDG